MKLLNSSRIATIIYANYTENVDMCNPLFKQSELDTLVRSDKDIIRVDYYIGGVFVGNKMYTPKQAAAQILKLNASAAKIEDKKRPERGEDWYKSLLYNQTRQIEINNIQDRIQYYTSFLTEDVFNEMLSTWLCCSWEDWVG